MANSHASVLHRRLANSMIRILFQRSLHMTSIGDIIMFAAEVLCRCVRIRCQTPTIHVDTVLLQLLRSFIKQEYHRHSLLTFLTIHRRDNPCYARRSPTPFQKSWITIMSVKDSKWTSFTITQCLLWASCSDGPFHSQYDDYRFTQCVYLAVVVV